MSDALKERMLRAAADAGKARAERLQAFSMALKQGATAAQAGTLLHVSPLKLEAAFAGNLELDAAFKAFEEALPAVTAPANGTRGALDLQKRALGITADPANLPQKAGVIPPSHALAHRRTKDDALGKLAGPVIKAAKALDPVLEKLGIQELETDIELVLDRTGSMAPHYMSRSMHKVADRFLALGHRLQPEGKVRTYTLGDGADATGIIDVEHYQPGHVDRMLDAAGRELDGSTHYAPVLRMLEKDLPLLTSKPSMATIVTDGQPHDSYDAEQVIERLANRNLFLQFVALGENVEKPMERYKGDYGRLNTWAKEYRHVGFIAIEKGDSLDDAVFFERLITQFANWALGGTTTIKPAGAPDLMKKAGDALHRMREAAAGR